MKQKAMNAGKRCRRKEKGRYRKGEGGGRHRSTLTTLGASAVEVQRVKSITQDTSGQVQGNTPVPQSRANYNPGNKDFLGYPNRQKHLQLEPIGLDENVERLNFPEKVDIMRERATMSRTDRSHHES